MSTSRQKKRLKRNRENIRKGLKAKYIAAGLTIVLEIAMIVAALLVGYFAKSKEHSCTKTVDAVVTNVETRIKPHINRKRHGIQTETTATITVETDGVFTERTITQKTAKYHKDQKLVIYYDPGDPSCYYIEGELEEAKVTSTVIYVIAALWAFVCLIVVRAVLKDRKKLKSKELSENERNDNTEKA